jgi:hypothetical protein
MLDDEMFSGAVEARPPRAFRDADSRFIFEVVDWCRHHGVHTRVLPTDELATVGGTATLSGYLLRHERASTIAYAGFLVLVAGTVLRLAAEGTSSAALSWVGLAALALATGLWLGSWWTWHAARESLVVGVFAGSTPVGVDALRQWTSCRATAAPRRWIFAGHGFTPEALAFAEAAGLHGWVAGPDGFGPAVGPPRASAHVRSTAA